MTITKCNATDKIGAKSCKIKQQALLDSKNNETFCNIDQCYQISYNKNIILSLLISLFIFYIIYILMLNIF